MANTTWYSDGMATVVVGSRTVIGTDTGWLTEVAGLTPIKAGDKFGIHVGRPIVIEQIISDTELLLADDWPGPAQTDAPYKVELTSPTIAAVEAMRRLLAALSNGNLDSIADATIGTDDLLIGIGPGVLAPVNKANLGYLVGPSSSTDGAFAGFDGTAGNRLKQLSASSALAIVKTAGAYAKDNILGTVSQSGGVPTGAVMEAGSNANGIYVRFASGIQLCSFQLPLSYSTASDMTGNWSYPAGFSDSPFISFGETQFWSGAVKSYAMRTRSANRGSSGMIVVSGNPSSNNASGDIYYVHVKAEGRWF